MLIAARSSDRIHYRIHCGVNPLQNPLWGDLSGEQYGDRNVVPLTRGKGGAKMSRLPDNPDRDFSAGCRDDIHDHIADNLFESLIVGYSQLLDDSRVRFRIGEIIARAMSRPTRLPRR